MPSRCRKNFEVAKVAPVSPPIWSQPGLHEPDVGAHVLAWYQPLRKKLDATSLL